MLFKRTAGILAVSCAVTVSVLWIFCAVPEGPDHPSKTSVNSVMKTSDGTVFDHPIEVSVGNKVYIGAAVHLPQYIDSVSIVVSEKENSVFSNIFIMAQEGSYDTVWLPCTFSSAGAKTITITPFTYLTTVSPIVTVITINDISEPPATFGWLFDTLSYAMNSSASLDLDLTTLLAVQKDETMTISLLPGSPESDSINVSNYLFTATALDVGNHYVNLQVADNSGETDLLVLQLSVEDNITDTSPPRITLISPSDTNIAIDSDSYTISLLCSDASNVASVTAVAGALSVPAVFTNGYYRIELTGLSTATFSEITITAIDAATPPNSISRTLHVITDDQMYSITYTASGDVTGQVPVDGQSYSAGTQVIVAGNTGKLLKAGFVFVGWNTAEDGSGTTYHAGETIEMGAGNVTLYALWTTDPIYTVTYEGNGNTAGEVPVDPNNYLTGMSVSVRANTGNLIKTDVVFTGWNTLADGSGTAYAPGAVLTIGANNAVLFAQWDSSDLSYTITYNGNGNTAGAVPTDAANYTTGMTVTVQDNTGDLAKTGSTFSGWNTAADGTGDTYTSGATITVSSVNIVLYAQWSTEPTYSVSYDGNGNTGGTVPVDGTGYVTGMTVTVKDNTGNLVKTSSSFTGWNTAADGMGTPYAAGAAITMASSGILLYAQWTADPTYKVTYDGNDNTGGTVPTDNTGYLNGSSVIVRDNTGNLIKSGSLFTGWNTAADGSGTAYAAASTLIMGTEEVTLYAVWSTATYQLTVSAAEGGTITAPSSSPITVDYGAATTITAVPGAGNDFVNWTATGGAEITDASSATTTVSLTSGDATVTANFTSEQYQLTVTAVDGGTITAPASSPATVNHGEATTITAAPDDGYEFTGWTITGTASVDDASSATTTVTLTSGDATITAGFIHKQYQLTVSAAEGGTITAPSRSPATVNEGEATTITASAGDGFDFSGWTVSSGTAAIANENTITTTVTLESGDAEVTAEFTKKQYELTVSAGEGGSISAPANSPMMVDHGAATSITASPNNGWSFVKWVVTGGNGVTLGSSTSASTSVTLTSQDAVIQANFEANRPTATATPVTQTVCAGTVVTVTANATGGTPPYSYWWSGSGTNQSYTVNTLGESGTRTFFCIVTDANGMEDTTNQVSVTINQPPTIQTQPQDASVCEGSQGNLYCSGPAGATFQWHYGNGTAIAGATSSSYGPTITATRSFYCVVTSSSGCTAQSTTATLTALEPPSNSGQGNRTNSLGDVITFAALASGTPPYEYEWRVNGTIIGASAMCQYECTATGTFHYSLTVTDASGCSFVDGPYTLTVTTP